jgi:hypothetical protein
MLKRSIRLPAMLLAVALVLGVVLVTADAIKWNEDAGSVAGIISDFRAALATILVVACIWIAVALLLDVLSRVERGQGSLARALQDLNHRVAELERGADTVAIPRMRIVGTAAVAATPIEVAPSSLVPPDNVLAFEAGRRFGEQRGS